MFLLFKKMREIAVIAAIISLFGAASFADSLENGLIGYWKLDEFAGNVAFDSSGNGNNGNIVGPSWYDDAIMGPVLDFEGADYISIPAGVFDTVTDEITISLWQWGDEAAQPQKDTIFEGLKNGNRILNAHLPWGSGNVIWDAGYSGGEYDRVEVSAGASYNFKGKWNHWAFVKDTVSEQMEIYLNGKLWTIAGSKSRPLSGVTKFRIGSAADGTGNYDGMICEFRVYNRKLSLGELEQLALRYVSSDPSPAHKGIDADPYPTLSWTSGPYAVSHDLYLGTDAQLVAVRDPSVYVGRMTGNSYTPEMLRLATDYYWAVDDVNNAEPISPWLGDVWKFSVRHVNQKSSENTTEGYYRDLFIDGGHGLTSYKASDIPAVDLLNYSREHVTGGGVLTWKLINESNDGEWLDDNGVLLYPDNEPRFRMIFVNGGSSGTHKDRLEPLGTLRMQTYVNNGGSYTGSCAGAWLTGRTKWDLAEPHLSTTNTGKMFTAAIFPDGQSLHKKSGRILPRSPFIDYYPDVFGDLWIFGIYHNGGCRVNVDGSRWHEEKTEALVLFDMTYARKAGETKIRNLLIPEESMDPNNTNHEQIASHMQCMVWAHKQTPEHGKLVPSGSHPEHRTTYGVETPLQASIFQYAFSGAGRPTAKADLTSGITRIMNDNENPGYEKIGDLQYHHFTIEVPEGTKELEIVLDGQSYDMNLYAKRGDFAFEGEKDVFYADNTVSSDEVLVVQDPKAGTWYISVKCNDRVDREWAGDHVSYTGKFDLLNGIPYAITAQVKNPVAGDVNGDDQVGRDDLKIMQENWLTSNRYVRQIRDLVGHWNFDEGSGNLALDSSGYNNTAEFYGDINWVEGGLSFDRDGDYLQTINSIDRLQLSDSYTISFKLNPAGTQSEGAGIITKCGPELGIPANHWAVGFGYNESAGHMVVYHGMEMWDSGIELSDMAGSEHEVTIIYGGEFIRSYLDGIEIKCEKFAVLPLNGAGHLKIGCERQRFRYFSGQINDIRIFDYELTVEELMGTAPHYQPDGPVGKWTFENLDASESSGNNFDGVLMGDASVIEDEQRGRVLNLEGTAYVVLPAGVFDTVTDEVTIMLWQYGAASQPQKDSIFEGIRNGDRVFNVHLPWDNEAVFWDAGCDGSGNYDRISKPVSSQDYKGRWNHWAFTKNCSTGIMSIYLNGELWYSETGMTKSMDGVTSFTISKQDLSYAGKIDDFQVFDYALDESEIRFVYEDISVNKDMCPVNPAGDLNNDCRVDYKDFSELAGNWLRY